MHRRGRQRDEYGRFLPRESINLNEEIEEEVEFPFEDARPDFQARSSSREETLDKSRLQPFAKILASFLDFSTLNQPVVNNLLPNVPF